MATEKTFRAGSQPARNRFSNRKGFPRGALTTERNELGPPHARSDEEPVAHAQPPWKRRWIASSHVVVVCPCVSFRFGRARGVGAAEGRADRIEHP